jgi:hypothetical protein
MYGRVLIPKGARVEPANNLPPSAYIKYWVKPWRGMTRTERMHACTYGFGVGAEDVIK